MAHNLSLKSCSGGIRSPVRRAAHQLFNPAILQSSNPPTLQPCNYSTLQPSNPQPSDVVFSLYLQGAVVARYFF